MPAPHSQSLALLTDLYQLTMAQGYWLEGLENREAVFNHYFRTAPFGGAFAVSAGLDTALEWLESFRFHDDDMSYLAGLCTQNGQPLFTDGFLDFLRDVAIECHVDAVPEGRLVFPHEPLIRVRGPLLQCQLVETALLNIVNFQSLIATKAARVGLAAGDDPVLEFGLRRAQGIDGGISASRAAYIGGCAATSNVLAGKLYGIPVRGTHAHSWVLAFDGEAEAFAAFAAAMPDNCVLLVDTFDTEKGLSRAIDVGLRLRASGFHLRGIRLDSGDLGGLARAARQRLDQAGLRDTAIVASNDLDEYKIADLRRDGSPITIWGVGTSIAAAKGQSALNGVYKLSMLRDPQGNWMDKAKRSEELVKASIPGMLQVRRYAGPSGLRADLIFDELHPPSSAWRGNPVSMASPAGKPAVLTGNHEDLLVPVLRNGRRVAPAEGLDVAQRRCRAELRQLPAGLAKPQATGAFPVLLETRLARRRAALFEP